MKRLAGVLVASLAALGCRSPTQITFDVSTNVPCAMLQSTTLATGPLSALTDDRPPATTAPRCTTEGHIGSIVVVPSGDEDDLVAVKIVTGVAVPPDQCGPHGEGCIVAKRALRFLPHEPLTVDVAMDLACEGVECGGDETCVQGACESAVIGDPSACEGSGCGDAVLQGVDGGAVSDAGTRDATIPVEASAPADAGVDAPTDAAPDDAGHQTPTSIGISENFGCALLPDRTVACWGHNDHGELGNGSEDPDAYAPTPVRVPGLDHVVRLVVGDLHACVLLEDAGVSCWGFAEYGATGTNDSTDDLVPTHVADLEPAGLLAAGQNETCAASVDGRRIWCWGIYLDEYDGTDLPTLVPQVDAGVVELSGGRGVTCGRFDDGTVRCWGQNGYGILGQGGALSTDASATAPVTVPGLPSPAQVSVALTQACVVDSSQRLWCWGENDMGELGPVDAGAFAASPVSVAVDPHVKKVACGEVTTCILYDDGGTLCWGYDYEGELGVADPGGSIVGPITIPNLGAATDIFAGGYGQCATLVGGGVACWGNDANLQLGAGAGLPAMPIGAYPVLF